jgi:hypothetical protein
MSDLVWLRSTITILMITNQKARLKFNSGGKIARKTLPYRGIANTLLHAPNREAAKRGSNRGSFHGFA